MVFSRKMVQILPGYPKQSPEDPEVTMVAFYLSLPAKVSQVTVVPKDTLSIIVESNIRSIERSMDSFIVSVKPLSLPAKESQTNNYKSNKLGANHTAAIVGGAVGGCLFLVVIVVLLRAYGRRKRYVHDTKEGCFNQPVGEETVFRVKVVVCRKTVIFVYLRSSSILYLCCHYRFGVVAFVIKNRCRFKPK